MQLPHLKPQEIPLDSPQSSCHFNPASGKPFVATRAAMHDYGDVLIPCLTTLQKKARQHNDIDYLQVFEDRRKPEALWFIEDGPGGAITALLPSEY